MLTFCQTDEKVPLQQLALVTWWSLIVTKTYKH